MRLHAAPCASVSMCIVHAGGARQASVHCLTIPGLWRLSNTCFLLLNSFLFSSCSLGFYGRLTPLLSSLSESLAVGCVQHLFLHLTLPNTYIAKAQPHCPPRPPSPRNVPPQLCPCEMYVWVMPDSWAWAQIDIPKHDRKSKCDRHVCTYIRTSQEQIPHSEPHPNALGNECPYFVSCCNDQD